MGSTFFGLDIALSGIFASNTQLNTTAHNISNAETEGYTRQVVNTQASKALKTYTTYGMVGTGIDVTGIDQLRNEYFDLKYWKTNTLAGEYTTKEYYVNCVENYFNEINDNGFTATFDKFYDALEQLSNDPSSLEKREQVAQIGSAFADYFNDMSSSLDQIQTDLNFEIQNTVDTINSIAEEISVINLKINTLELAGQKANDLRDQRNLLIDQLSNYVSVEVEEKVVNKTDISMGQKMCTVKIDGQTLVDTYNYNTLKCVPREYKANQNDIRGLYDVSWTTDDQTGEVFSMYSGSLGGVLQALTQMRDGNNLENLYGKVSASVGDKQVTMTGASINSISKLNIPNEGYVTIGAIDYKYNGFTVDIEKNALGSDVYTYTFDLEEPIKLDADSVTAHIGETVDYKGVAYYKAQMNEFLRTFSDKFNKICNESQDLKGNAGKDFFVFKNEVTGEYTQLKEYDEITSFTSSDDTYYRLTMGNFKVNKSVIHDPNTFPAASDTSMGVANNIGVRSLLALKRDETMFKQGQPASFLQTLISEIGVDSASAKSFSKNQNTILNSISNQRLSKSGVDKDEEAMNLITYQNMYQLNAKVVSIMNEVLNTLINQMGL